MSVNVLHWQGFEPTPRWLEATTLPLKPECFFSFQVKVYDDIQEELKVKTDALKKSKLKVRLLTLLTLFFINWCQVDAILVGKATVHFNTKPEVKQRWAWIVLWLETAWELQVPLAWARLLVLLRRKLTVSKHVLPNGGCSAFVSISEHLQRVRGKMKVSWLFQLCPDLSPENLLSY